VPSPTGFPGRIGTSSSLGRSLSDAEFLRAASMLIRLTRAAGSSTISCSFSSPPLGCAAPDRFLSNRSAPSRYPLGLSICLESIDFFRRSPPAEPWRPNGPSGDNVSESPERRLILSTFSSINVLNSLGASSGCRRAGTQNSFEASCSSSFSEKFCGALGRPNLLNDGRSGSEVFTSIDMRRIACRLLNSCANPAGLDS
jgi:hypothetical protein